MSDDLIKKSDAIATIEKRKEKIVSNYESDKWFRKMISEVEAIPSADRPQGEWINIGGYEVCKNCHEVKRFPHWNFCPNCGARMK